MFNFRLRGQIFYLHKTKSNEDCKVLTCPLGGSMREQQQQMVTLIYRAAEF